MLPDETKVNARDEQNKTLFLAGDFDKLYEINYPLLVYLTKKYNHNIEDFEEAISLSNYCFARAIKVYDPDKANFSTYLGMVIQGYFYRHYRDQKTQKRNTDNLQIVSLQQTIQKNSESKKMALEEILDLSTTLLEDEVIGQVTVEEFIKETVKIKNGRVSEVLKLRLQGLTQKEIAKLTSTSQAQVSRDLLSLKKAWEAPPQSQIQQQMPQTKEKQTQPYKRGETNMGKLKNPIDKLEEAIRLIEQDIAEIEIFAAALGVTKQLAKTYRFAALREIEKRKDSPGKLVPNVSIEDTAPKEVSEVEVPTDTKAPEPEAKPEQPKPQKTTKEKKSSTISGDKQNPAISTIPSPQTLQKRLKPTVVIVASEEFEFKVEKTSILITLLGDKEVITLPKENLQNFIDDLKQVVNYL